MQVMNRNNRNECLTYFIEKIIIDKSAGKAILKGWGLNLGTKEPIEFYFMGTNAKGIGIKRELRVDINCKYNLPNEKYGFNIEFGERFIGKKIKLVLKSGSKKKVIKLNIENNYYYSKDTKIGLSSGVNIIKKTINYFQRNGFKNTVLKIKFKLNKDSLEKYNYWIDKNENYVKEDILSEIASFKKYPKISIIMPVYNVEEKWLSACINSVLNQFYENWELCIADDNSDAAHVKPLLKKYEEADSRIKVVYRDVNGHISEASNSALKIATGDYIGLLDNDDLLPDFSLFEVVKCINKHPEADLIYSDEDKITENNVRTQPFFKSDWAPDTLLSTNYICHFGIYRKKIIDEINGFKKGFEGAQDYDLVLRFTEKTDKIYHIPKILYHWRMIENSTAANPASKKYAFEAGKRALEEALKRRKIKGVVHHGKVSGIYDIGYYIDKEDLVTIIIPTRDRTEDIKRCLESIYRHTKYTNYEIIIVDNGSRENELIELLSEYSKKHQGRFRTISIDIPFNFSKINNLAAREAKGKYLLFLNNDTEVFSPEWINQMVGYAQQERIGAIGTKLLYPDNTIQHGGVILGIGGLAGHAHLDFPKNDYGYFGKLIMNSNFSAVTGACLMVSKENFEKINGFEESLAVAFNDVDLCLKLQKLGKNNVFLHNVQIFHCESKSRGKEDTFCKDRRFQSELDYMKEKWTEIIMNDPNYNVNLTLADTDYSISVDLV